MFFSLQNRYPLARETDALHIIYNDEYLSTFVKPDDKIVVHALVIDDSSIQKARELYTSKNYRVAVRGALLYWFPMFILQQHNFGFKEAKAFEQERNLI